MKVWVEKTVIRVPGAAVSKEGYADMSSWIWKKTLDFLEKGATVNKLPIGNSLGNIHLIYWMMVVDWTLYN